MHPVVIFPCLYGYPDSDMSDPIRPSPYPSSKLTCANPRFHPLHNPSDTASAIITSFSNPLSVPHFPFTHIEAKLQQPYSFRTFSKKPLVKSS